MKKVGDLMAELGFREDGSDSVKRAFVENLMKAAYGPQPVVKTTSVSAPSRSEPKPVAKPLSAKASREHQLSFDFDSAESDSQPTLAAKVQKIV